MSEPITRDDLEHVLRTILQVVENAYYRAGYLTTEHTVFEVLKRALEHGIGTLDAEREPSEPHVATNVAAVSTSQSKTADAND